MSVNRCGRPKQETSCCADRSDIGRQDMLRNFVPDDGRGAWQRLAVHARVTLSVEQSWDVPIMLRGASQTRKKRL